MTSQEKKDKGIAAGVTMLVALAILLWLFFTGLSWDREKLAAASIPEEAQEEELFLDPELLNLGEEDATANDQPAPNPLGEPEPAPVDNNRLIEPGENPKPAPPQPKMVSTPKESEVKSTEPTVTDKERQKITSSMSNKFSGKNGKPDGKNGSNGSGGDGIGVQGFARGRAFQGCPKPYLESNHKLTVTVNVVVDESGRVTHATAAGGASATIRRACEQAALKARWSAKKGAGETRGTLTFTITPQA